MRKGAMNWIFAGVLVTLVGNATNVILHALTKRGWWCGKDYVVSSSTLSAENPSKGKEEADETAIDLHGAAVLRLQLASHLAD